MSSFHLKNVHLILPWQKIPDGILHTILTDFSCKYIIESRMQNLQPLHLHFHRNSLDPSPLARRGLSSYNLIAYPGGQRQISVNCTSKKHSNHYSDQLTQSKLAYQRWHMTAVVPPTVLPSRFDWSVCSNFLIRFAMTGEKWSGVGTCPDKACL